MVRLSYRPAFELRAVLLIDESTTAADEAIKVEALREKSDAELFGDDLARIGAAFPKARVFVQRHGIQQEVDASGRAQWVWAMVADAIVVPSTPGS